MLKISTNEQVLDRQNLDSVFEVFTAKAVAASATFPTKSKKAFSKNLIPFRQSKVVGPSGKTYFFFVVVVVNILVDDFAFNLVLVVSFCRIFFV